MQALIVNLRSSVDRREYMTALLKRIPFLEYRFIDGVDGRILTDEERENRFDTGRSLKRYGRACTGGEQGCTLSHQKCYRTFLESDRDKVCILEDDVMFDENRTDVLRDAWDLIGTDKPEILLLSGGYWYKRTLKKTNYGKLVSVFDAYYTHSYIMNRPAAELLRNERPFFLADDWRHVQSLGIDLRAVTPHIFDQKVAGFQSLISSENTRGIVRKKISWKENIRSYCEGAVRKTLKMMKKYENS